MSINNFSQKQLLDLAYTTNDKSVFQKLAAANDMFVRRAVARNNNTPQQIIDKLAYDPVQNVSFIALQHRNCTLTREIQSNHPCVTCLKDERYMDCINCDIN